MKKLITLLIALLFAVVIAFSQEPPHPGGGNPPGSGDPPVGGGAPIDGGITLLIVLGMAYGSKKHINSL